MRKGKMREGGRTRTVSAGPATLLTQRTLVASAATGATDVDLLTGGATKVGVVFRGRADKLDDVGGGERVGNNN
jgi:hypothetical protein